MGETYKGPFVAGPGWHSEQGRFSRREWIAAYKGHDWGH